MAFTVDSNIATQSILLAICTIVVAFRLITSFLWNRGRKRSIPSIASDVCIAGSLIFLAIGATFALIRCRKQKEAAGDNAGFVIESVSLRIEDLPEALKGILAESFTYIASLWLIKGALLAMVFDIRRHLGKKLKLWLYFTAGFTLASFWGLIIMGFTKCIPFKRNWTFGPDFCTPVTKPVLIAVTVLTILNDLFIFAIPVLLVRLLKMPSSMLVAIAFTIIFFLTGTVLAIIRIAIVFPYADVKMSEMLSAFSVDSIGRVEFFSGFQLALNLIIISVPQLRMFYRRHSKNSDTEFLNIADERVEFLGMLPKDVGHLIITKTVQVQITTVERGMESMTQLHINGHNRGLSTEMAEMWKNGQWNHK